MATNFGTKIAITGFVCTIAIRLLIMEGSLSGGPTKCRYCRYTATKGRCYGKHFLSCYICGAHWSHPANTTEPSVYGSDAALCQITLTTCFCLFVYEISQERLNRCAPNSHTKKTCLVLHLDKCKCQGQRSWSPATNFLPIENAL